MTARPRLAHAPAAVRAAVTDLLGEAIHTETPAPAGFTPSIASTINGRLFIKAAPIGDGLGEAVETGATLAHTIGDLGPRLLGSAAPGQWRIAAYELIHGDTVTRWTDLIRLAPDLAACGHDPEHLLRQSPWPDAPHDDVNATLAGLAGRAWRDGHLPGPAALRHMQQEQGLHLLRWLHRRLNQPGSH
jgi:hypothetical protein